LPLVVKCSIKFKNILSINVSQWWVILVGCNMWGWKKYVPSIFMKCSVTAWVSNFRRSKLKSPGIAQYFPSLWILSKEVFKWGHLVSKWHYIVLTIL
jgi:hypothetical protein